MQKIPLSEFVRAHGQTGAGNRLGVTQGAIRKALAYEREIYVTDHGDGTFSAKEIKPFPSTEIKILRAGNQWEQFMDIGRPQKPESKRQRNQRVIRLNPPAKRRRKASA